MLSKEQKAAARPSTGASLIIAGAGSGKTRTLVERVRNTIAEGLCSAAECLVMTFSSSAAEEIRARAPGIYAGTFHSVALSLLGEFTTGGGEHAMRPKVIGEAERESLLRGIFSVMRDQFIGLPFDCVYSVLSLDIAARRRFLDSIADELHAPFGDITRRYETHKAERGIIDYDDMVPRATALLRDSPENLSRVRDRFRFIFVDEYQDLSEELFEFVNLLAGCDGNICAVGDPNQAIYGFRGGDPRFITGFRTFFRGASLYPLTMNYRSKKEIVDLSSVCISRNAVRTKKRAQSGTGKGGVIQWHRVASVEEEGSRIISILDNENNCDDAVALIARTNRRLDEIRGHIEGRGRHDCLDHVAFHTIHGAKGLEFECVIVAGIEDGVFPSDLSHIEEERRLLYVAVTRARSRLHLVYYADNNSCARFARESFLSRRWFFRSIFHKTRRFRAVGGTNPHADGDDHL
jgi:DNA helicase-2/ATP-dependent DNA helicase PcrA